MLWTDVLSGITQISGPSLFISGEVCKTVANYTDQLIDKSVFLFIYFVLMHF